MFDVLDDSMSSIDVQQFLHDRSLSFLKSSVTHPDTPDDFDVYSTAGDEDNETSYISPVSKDMWLLMHLLAKHATIEVEDRHTRETFFDKQIGESSMRYCIHLIATALSRYYSADRGKLGQCVRRSLCDSSIIEVCVSLLPKVQRRSALSTDSELLQSEQMNIAANELTKICLQFLANILYNCREAQDKFRGCGGLAAVLEHCGTNFENPFSREWALFCVKNACENNQESMEFIHGLKPQEVIQDDSLAAHGIKIQLDPNSGTFRFEQDIQKRNSKDER